MGKRIGITYDVKPDWAVGGDEPQDANAEFDKPETIESFIKALEAGGHTVKRIGNARALLDQIDSLDVDIIFNLCEGRSGRTRESEVPVLCDMKGIPYVGADGLTLAISLDKPVAKKIFIAEGIPTPRFFTAETGNDLEKLNTIGYPLMVKTSREGSSKGIHEDAKVTSLKELKSRVEYINATYHQPALVEEFIKGYEFTVAVLGNENPEVMPVVQTTINGKRHLGEEFYTNARIYNKEVVYECPAKITDSLRLKLEDLSARVYKAVGCRDFGRIDFRVDDNENPYVLEINPLPSLDQDDVFYIFPQVLGSNFSETMNIILNFALKRCHLLDKMDTDQEAVKIR